MAVVPTGGKDFHPKRFGRTTPALPGHWRRRHCLDIEGLDRGRHVLGRQRRLGVNAG